MMSNYFVSKPHSSERQQTAKFLRSLGWVVQIGISNMTSIVILTVVLALFGIIPPVADAQAVDSSIRYQLTPFNLLYLAYHGHFEQDGIDGGSQAGDVDPEMLIQVAIKHHWLPEQTLSDKAYLNGLNVVINGFNTD